LNCPLRRQGKRGNLLVIWKKGEKEREFGRFDDPSGFKKP